MKKHFFSFFRLAFIVLVLFSFSNCEKDEIVTIEHEETTNHVDDRTSYYNIGSEVSRDIVSYLQLKSSNTLNVKFTKTGISLSDGTYIEREESALGTVLTDKEVVVVNELNTKHTFDVRTPNHPNSKTNLIVTETENHLYEYFLRYNFNGSQSEGSFSGSIEAFDNSGALIGTATIKNGIAISIVGTLNPDCFEDNSDTEENDTDSSNTGNPVGGGVSTGDTDTPNPSSGGEYVDPDNEPCTIQVVIHPCNRGYTDWHPPRGNPKCSGSIATITGCGISWSIEGRNAINTNSQDPCAGTAGVILNFDLSIIDGITPELSQWLDNHLQYKSAMQIFYNQEHQYENTEEEIKIMVRSEASDVPWTPYTGNFHNVSSLGYTHLRQMTFPDGDNYTEFKLHNGDIIMDGDFGTTTESNHKTYYYSKENYRLFEITIPFEYESISLDFLWNNFWSVVQTGVRYCTPLEDAVILIDGKDFDGVEQSRAVSGLFILMEIVPGAKVLKITRKAGSTVAAVVPVVTRIANATYKTQKKLVKRYKHLIATMSNAKKGRWAEMATDTDLIEKGYKEMHTTRITSIDNGGHNGIDHVFKNEQTGEFLIVESKYSPSGNMAYTNPPNPATDLPRQMSDDWLEYANNLGNAVGDDFAEEILETGYRKLVSIVNPDGTIVYRLIDEFGHVISGANGIYTP